MSQGGSIWGGRKSMFGKEGSDDVVVDLNLTPLMDVMSNILFFLLASFGAAIISFLAASVPVQAEPSKEPPQVKTDTVTVHVQITPDAYKVNCSNDDIPRDRLDRFKVTIAKTKEGYDRPALTEALAKIKIEFPASDTILLVPSDTTIYEDIVQTMEATREIKRDGQRLRLFPKTVVADIVKAE